ncbi:uncharacterized protein LOC114451583 [Parambassis ranga]|uniref:S-adenosylmethionine synthase n=1 Tax=Parambassis ranga TaxID=210632 RepID=A0A6P7K9P6_9TELE|nr:uncharacterized protein LOC114451583 [Parambassis ranga]
MDTKRNINDAAKAAYLKERQTLVDYVSNKLASTQAEQGVPQKVDSTRTIICDMDTKRNINDAAKAACLKERQTLVDYVSNKLASTQAEQGVPQKVDSTRTIIYDMDTKRNINDAAKAAYLKERQTLVDYVSNKLASTQAEQGVPQKVDSTRTIIYDMDTKRNINDAAKAACLKERQTLVDYVSNKLASTQAKQGVPQKVDSSRTIICDMDTKRNINDAAKAAYLKERQTLVDYVSNKLASTQAEQGVPQKVDSTRTIICDMDTKRNINDAAKAACLKERQTLVDYVSNKLASTQAEQGVPQKVTVHYAQENGAVIPKRVHTVVISVQHDEYVSLEEQKRILKEKVIKAVVPSRYLDENTVYHLQPSGRFVIGGPQGDAGVTGRKIIVDTYGGWGAHGGGAFSGKDYTKVDRSAAYAARWVAKSLVKAKLCRRVLVQVAYAIGVSHPLSISLFTYGSSHLTEKELLQIINKNFDLRPGVIVRDLDLKRPIYQKTACYGHFGRKEFPWEVPKNLNF